MVAAAGSVAAPGPSGYPGGKPATPAGLYARPVLVADPGHHSAPLLRADADAAGRFAVTAAEDKTARVWSLADGALLRTIRLPAGPGDVGKAFSVAIDPAGELVAVGGKTHAESGREQIYLFTCGDGALVRRIEGLPGPVLHLAFAPDGRHLAAALKAGGLRVFGRDADWEEVARDEDYGAPSYFAAFAADGRFATTALDGNVRLYDQAFARAAVRKTPSGDLPFGLAFDARGARLAVGYHGAVAVDLFDAHSLAPLPGPDVAGIDNWLVVVAWAEDGTLLAGGWYQEDGVRPVVAWGEGGRGSRRTHPAGRDTLVSLRPLPGGDLLAAAQDPWIARLAPDGRPRWVREAPLVDLRHETRTLAVSADGCLVAFRDAASGGAALRFDVAGLALGRAPAEDDGRTSPPRLHGLDIKDWERGMRPTLGGERLPLEPYEESRSFAVHPDGRSFVHGGEYRLRAFDARGKLLWMQSTPAVAWAVNVAADGRLAVVAYQDGTIRWHRADDGQELLAFMPLADGANWLAWTPEGYHATSPRAQGILRWHFNRGWEPGETRDVADIPGGHRPAALPLVLRELDVHRAVGLAETAKLLRDVQAATRSSVPPGAQLHVLAIGVSRYNAERAAHLRLAFAEQDARDVASALVDTQGGLYTSVNAQLLADEDANRMGIRRAFGALRGRMTGVDDLAVVHFSGHGALVNEHLYLLTHEVDAQDADALEDTALPFETLRDYVGRLAERGRVLVLLDACYSGAAALGGTAAVAEARQLSAALAQANVCVLTSSSADEVSREDPAWQNGALTRALLDGLGGDADQDQDGLIGATELAHHVVRRVRGLTGDAQRPSIEVRFDGPLFAVGPWSRASA